MLCPSSSLSKGQSFELGASLLDSGNFMLSLLVLLPFWKKTNKLPILATQTLSFLRLSFSSDLHFAL